MTVNVLRGWPAVVAAVVLAAGCSSGASTPNPNGSSPSPLPKSAPAWAKLAAAAQAGRGAYYTARYRLVTSTSVPVRSVSVYKSRNGLRIDLIGHTSTTVLLENKHGVYSCLVTTKTKFCLLVARPGGSPPRVLDPGLQYIFSTYLSIFATKANSYAVLLVGTTAARGSVPAGTCFRVHVAAHTPRPLVSNGRYCFTAGGIPTELVYRSGRLVLQSVAAPPGAAAFKPVAAPTPLPH